MHALGAKIKAPTLWGAGMSVDSLGSFLGTLGFAKSVANSDNHPCGTACETGHHCLSDGLATAILSLKTTLSVGYSGLPYEEL